MHHPAFSDKTYTHKKIQHSLTAREVRYRLLVSKAVLPLAVKVFGLSRDLFRSHPES